MADVRINTWEVHGEGREFETVSGEFQRAAVNLEQQLAGLGTPWGTDEPGVPFGGAYGEAREGVLAGLQGLADRLGRIGTGLHTMADSVEHTDRQVKVDFTGLEGGLGSAAPGATGHGPGAV
ncbi:hypothetical protein ACGFX4_24360 [Kitasatospora sp. NPDC048365]|uniref:hypothetical protein n=1 Tax=Kitasatospora sp. NPDC048365 TaxID=3364050 RepID=UPI003718C867